MDRVRERDDDQILVIGRFRRRSLGRQRAMKAAPPGIEPRLALGGRQRALVGDVVGDPRERIDGCDVRPHLARQQARRHGKILVMRSGQRLACRVGARESRSHRGILVCSACSDA
jgi:hypothetical protein